MKNKEKYTNTDEAVKVFNTQRKMVMLVKGRAPSITFEDWLELDTFEDFINGILNKAVEFFKEPKLTEAPVCPICGGKNTIVSNMLFTSLHCEDCDAVVLFQEDGKPRKESMDNFARRLANKGKL
jgi:hypothetical protein